MSALEQLKNAIKDARNSCKKFSTENRTNIPDGKLGAGTFTAAEAIHTFEDLLQSVETSMGNPHEVTKHIASSEMNSVTSAINSLSHAFSSNNYQKFTQILDGNLQTFRLFTMLSMEEMDSKRYKDISNMGGTLQEMKAQIAEVKTIFTKLSQQNKELEDILSKNNQLAKKQELALSTALRELDQINKWNKDAAKDIDSIKNTEGEVREIRGKLTSYDKYAETKSKELKELLENGKISLEKQTKTANDMIASAEKALHLSAAEGLSAEFSAKARDLGALKTKRWWLFFGIASSVIAVGIGWYTISFSSEWYILLPRFSLIGIFLAMSTFAFRQYSKNKSLEHDYNFKSALVGSYPGISAQIADEAARKEYDSKLIIEILQDPQRIRARKITPPASGMGK